MIEDVLERAMKLIAERRPEVGTRGARTLIAKACGISHASVTQWFSGETSNIRMQNLVAIAKELDTTVDWLLTGEGDIDRSGRSVAPAVANDATLVDDAVEAAKRLEEALTALVSAENGLLGVVAAEARESAQSLSRKIQLWQVALSPEEDMAGAAQK